MSRPGTSCEDDLNVKSGTQRSWIGPLLVAYGGLGPVTISYRWRRLGLRTGPMKENPNILNRLGPPDRAVPSGS
jgi:hypothetical protein